jgi:arylsulfatase A-like enzyme
VNRYLVILMCAGLLITGCSRETAVQDTQDTSVASPNIIYIMLDEWGYYEWSGMRHPVLETPNIDTMAAGGVRFTQMLAGSNVCAPTRSVLMTGQHSGHTTVRANGGGLALTSEDITVADMLKKAGYATGGFGKWGLGDAGTTGVPEKHGFDTFFGYYHQVHAHSYYPRYLLRNSTRVPLEGNTGDFYEGELFAHELIYQEGLNFIRDNKDRPFFAYFPWTPPHGRWAMPSDDPAWLKYRDKEWDASNRWGTKEAQKYAAMVEMVDRQIGEILDLVRELNIDRNTIIVVSGDNGGKDYFKNENHPHGFMAPNLDPVTGKRFRGGKGEFYEGGLRVPYIVYWPDRIKPAVSDHLGYFPDVMPTLAELAGIQTPASTDGISFLPTLLGEDEVGRRQAQHEYLYWESKGMRAVRMGNWKAVKPGEEAAFELYDLSTDLEELNDVAEQYPGILEQMKIYAMQAHSPPRHGQVLDPSAGFQGHKAD